MKHPVYCMTNGGLFLRAWVRTPWPSPIRQAEIRQLCPQSQGFISIKMTGGIVVENFSILKRRGHVFIVWDSEQEEEVTVRIA